MQLAHVTPEFEHLAMQSLVRIADSWYGKPYCSVADKLAAQAVRNKVMLANAPLAHELSAVAKAVCALQGHPAELDSDGDCTWCDRCGSTTDATNRYAVRCTCGRKDWHYSQHKPSCPVSQ